MHFKDFPKFWFFWIKPTETSKHPTNRELDELKEKLMWHLPSIIFLFKRITVEQVKWFFKYQWKKVTVNFLLVSSIIIGSYLFVNWLQDFTNYHNGKTKIVETKEVVYIAEKKSFEQFVYDVAMKESTLNMSIVSPGGMLGYFQFSENTLRNHLGFNVSTEDFLSDSTMQVAAFKQHIRLFLRSNDKKYVDKWNGEKMKGIKGTVTKSGIFMAFHLKPKEARAFFESNGKNVGKGDGNGTTVRDYIEKFSGYELQ